jgi:hypothetical protein
MTKFWKGLYTHFTSFCIYVRKWFFINDCQSYRHFSHLFKTKSLVSSASISLNIFGQDQTNGHTLSKDKKDNQTLPYSQFQSYLESVLLLSVFVCFLLRRYLGLLTFTGCGQGQRTSQPYSSLLYRYTALLACRRANNGDTSHENCCACLIAVSCIRI